MNCCQWDCSTLVNTAKTLESKSSGGACGMLVSVTTLLLYLDHNPLAKVREFVFIRRSYSLLTISSRRYAIEQTIRHYI